MVERPVAALEVDDEQPALRLHRTMARREDGGRAFGQEAIDALFKMMVHFMSGLAAGVVMGAKVPVVLTSRADPPEARRPSADERVDVRR